MGKHLWFGLLILSAGCLRLADTKPFICQEDGDCESSEHCIQNSYGSDGTCKPKSYCQETDDCTADEVCLSSVCVKVECTYEDETACAPFSCDSSTSQCFTECTSDEHCAPNLNCEEGNCVTPECNASNAATVCKNYGCDEQNHCKTSCAQNYDCTDGSKCVDSKCVVSCNELRDPVCAPYLCDLQSSVCATTCWYDEFSSDQGCTDGFVCEDQACIDPGTIDGYCTDTSECEGYICGEDNRCGTSCELDEECDYGAGYRCTDSKCAAVVPRVGDLSAGETFTCSLINGTLQCWGSLSESKADPGLAYVGISAGYEHVCGIDADGHAACWGQNFDARADGEWWSALAISADSSSTCVLLQDGSAECIDPSNQAAMTVPDSVPTLSSITVGAGYACGLDASGSPYCWGGLSTPDESNLKALDAGSDRLCGLTKGGAVLCWGSDGKRRTDVPAMASKAKQVTVGGGHACALLETGATVCWGAQGQGQSDVPDNVPSFARLSAGRYHTCGVTLGGKVTCWGDDVDGQSSVP